MSDREFENYLALLARLLRLGGKQRGQIARELRAHLEDRLEELLAQGVSREDAVRGALEEFGDAAGLAADFVSLSRTRKRRWLVKMTTYSVAATVLMAAAIATFWPGRNAGPGAALVVAQGPQAVPAGAPADPFAAPGSAPAAAPSKAEEADEVQPLAPGELEEKLSRLARIEFVEMPLKDAILYLQDQHGIPFFFKAKKLLEASISTDLPITMNLKGVRLSTALNLILEELGLTYVDQEEFVLITTPEDAKATLEIRVYDCRDLLAMAAPPGADKYIPAAGLSRVGGGGMFAVEDSPANARVQEAPGTPGGSGYGGERAAGGEQKRMLTEHDLRADQMIQLITTNVDSDTWEDTGSHGSISEYNGLIVVTQTAHTHKKIERVLNMLREAAGLDLEKAGKVVR